MVPGMNDTNNQTSLAKTGIKSSAALNVTKSASSQDGDSKIGIGKAVKVATVEVKKDSKKEEPKVKAFPKPDEAKKEEPKKEEGKASLLPAKP